MPKSKPNPISADKQQKRLDKAERKLVKVQERTPYIATKNRRKRKAK